MRSVLFVCLASIVVVSGKQFTLVELARELRRLDVSDWDIPTLICLAHNASSLRTDVTSRREDVEYTYCGLFGIPDALFDASDCGFLSETLATDDDISDDVRCVRNILKTTTTVEHNSRSQILGFLTPHDVDISKCFGWWESLPSFTDALMKSSPSAKLINPPETHVCKCVGAGALTNIFLFILDLILICMCGLGFLIYRRQKGIGYFNDKISNNPLL